jgi:hypothetical protein
MKDWVRCSPSQQPLDLASWLALVGSFDSVAQQAERTTFLGHRRLRPPYYADEDVAVLLRLHLIRQHRPYLIDAGDTRAHDVVGHQISLDPPGPAQVVEALGVKMVGECVGSAVRLL